MRELANDYVSGAESAVRDVYVKIALNDEENTVFEADEIVDLSISRSITDGSFGIGFTPSDRLSCTIISAEKVKKKTRITVYVRFSASGTWERLGRFYCDRCTRDGSAIQITAFDAMNLQDKLVGFNGVESKGLAALEFPCTMQQMLDYIVAYRGLTCEFECQPFTIQKKPVKSESETDKMKKYYTVREMLGFIAAAHGCNAKFDSSGKLCFQSFATVEAELTAANVLDFSIDDSEPFNVSGIYISTVDGSVYIDDIPGSEYDEEQTGVIKCGIPFGTVEIAEYIWHCLGGLSYYGGGVQIRGAGILECGDVIEIGNLKFPQDTQLYPFCVTGIRYDVSRQEGFIETLTSQVASAASGGSPADVGGGSGSGLTPCGEIRFTAGRLYIGDEEYRLQRGAGRRIIAVTQGKKCTQIYSDTEAESEAAAVAAVTHGLETPWDIEFDEYIAGGGWSVYLSSIIGLGECTSVEVDYGDGSKTFVGSALPPNAAEPPHTYEKQGIYHIRIKTDAKEITKLNLSSWERLKETDPERFNEGTSVYIGGGIEAVYNAGGYSQYIGRMTWGESVKYISGFEFVANKIENEMLDVSLPPFFVGQFKNGEKLRQALFSYVPLDYLYIPASCTYISYHGFAQCSLSLLEIEPEGESLELGESAFTGSASGSGKRFSEIKALDIPARVVFGYGEIFGAGGHYFDDCGIRAIRLQNGIATIPANCFYGCNTSGGFSVGNSPVVLRGSHPLYVFIPKTVASIKSSAFGGAVNILYEGSDSEWEAIAKDSGWCCGNDSKCNIECCNGSTVYYSAFDFLVANLRDVYSGGEGISVSGNGTISVKPALPSTYELGGVIPESEGFDYNPDTGVLGLKIASKDKLGVIRIGKGIQVTADLQTGKGGYADVSLGRGMCYSEVLDSEGNISGYDITPDLGSGIDFEEITDSDGNVIEYKISAKIGDGFRFDEKGKIILDLGAGLMLEPYENDKGNTAYRIVPNIGENLEIGVDGKINAKGGLTAGDGVDIQNNVINVKVDGDTVKFNENKELTAAGGSALTPGNGVDIQNNVVNVKVDGDTVKFDGSGALTAASGVVIDKAVIVQEAEAKYILHNFTQVEYLAGNKIGYAGPGNPIIVDGYVFYKNFNDVLALGSAPYTSATFAKASKTTNAMIENVDVYLSIVKVSSSTDSAEITIASQALNYNTTASRGTTTYDLSKSGLGFIWAYIYPPSDAHPNGYIYGNIFVYYINSSKKPANSAGLNPIYIDFASIAEYEAAVGLTYEPLTLTRVEDNPTIV